MNRKAKILFGVISIVLLAFGFIGGLIFKDLPKVTFNPEVKLYEVANILLTLAIGITIPLVVKKWIDDSRSIKVCIVDEVKDIIKTLGEIKRLISSCHTNLTISKEQKDEINYLFHQSELQIFSLSEQLKISFESESKGIIEMVKENYHIYKDYLTGGELMLSSFLKVDDRFWLSPLFSGHFLQNGLG